MAAYLIAEIMVTEPAGFARYRQSVTAVIAAHGGRYLVRGGQHVPLSADVAPARLVVIEFASMERLRAFYDGPDYAPLRALRERCSTARVQAVDGC